jgi:membrane associated rhomboid family serine protease
VSNIPPAADSGRQRAINLPPATAVLAGVLIGIHLLRQFLASEMDDSIVLDLALIPARLTELPLTFGAVATLFTHMLLHGSWLHLLANVGMMLAFSAGLERIVGPWRMLGLALLSGLAGGLVHLAVYPHDETPMLGASGAISGLFGAMIFVLSMRQRGWGLLLGISALWLATNLALGLSGMPGLDGDTIEIAWVAHVGGYVAGIAGMAALAYRARRKREQQ